jgi:hypothetical protein
MTWLQAGATVLGGLLGDRRRKKDQAFNQRMIAEQNAYNAPDAIRARAEKAGFNPLLFVGPGVGLQTSVAQAVGGNYLGSAIADAGLMAADALARQPRKAKLNAFQAENAKLKQQVQSLTLRPKVGGLYADRVVTPSIRDALGGIGSRVSPPGLGARGADRPSAAAPSAGLRPLVDVDPIDPRRAVDNKPVGSTSGFMKVDSPWLGPIYVPTLDGDEPVDILDLPAVGYVGSQVAYDKGVYLSYGGGSESRPKITRAESLALRDKMTPKSAKRFKPHGLRFDPFTASAYQ